MINWTDINLKNKTKGNFKTICPACSHLRKKKNDPCLSVNLDKGVAKCWNCEEISIRDQKQNKRYKLPNQNWHNYTGISDKLVKWFKEERGISQKTLIACRITEEEYFQPSLEKEVNNIVFNYFEGEVLINKKYRSANKRFTQTTGTQKILYGLNDIIGHDEIYIVEGEMDKLALMEVGYKNCVSVPNGAKDLSDYFETCETYLKDLKHIYIAVDTDEAGRSLERELIKRFGKWKCSRIEYEGYKDANELLVKGNAIKLQNALENPIPYPVDGTFTAEDIKDDLYDYYDNGLEDCIYPKSIHYEELNKVFKIHLGQLTTVTGIPSHGKSNFIEDYVLNLVHDYNFKASLFSPEHFPMKLHHGVLAEKVIGKPFNHAFHDNPRLTKDELEEYVEWSKERVFTTYPEKGEIVTWQWLLDKFKEQLFRYGIDIFIIDAFNKVKRKNPDSLGEINEILSELTLFAQAYNIHVFLIAHPVKMKKENGKYMPPTLYDVKGSGDFRDQTHNGLCIYRHFENKESGFEGYTEVINLKTKFKHQGEITGSALFKYDVSNGRYYGYNNSPNRNSMLNNNYSKVEVLPTFNNEEIFNGIFEDLPF